MADAGPREPDARALVEARTGRRIAGVSRLAGGANNRIYRVDCDGDAPCVVKFYMRAPSDPRDRLGTEYGALDLLWRRGVRAVPEPIASAREAGAGIYGFADGSPIGAVSDEDLAAVADFLRTLGAIGAGETPAAAPLASEACFSGHDAIASLSLRLARHLERVAEPDADEAYARFVKCALVPAIETVVRHSIPRFPEVGLDAALAPEERTLSPSDLGFHNMLRRADGSHVFLDFEYFGWDDPAKTVADFLLHPAMSLGEGGKRRFVQLCAERLTNAERVIARMTVLYPLCALKWCFILLNDFLPECAARRSFAAGGARDDASHKQLLRAAHTLAHAEASLEDLRLAA